MWWFCIGVIKILGAYHGLIVEQLGFRHVVSALALVLVLMVIFFAIIAK